MVYVLYLILVIPFVLYGEEDRKIVKKNNVFSEDYEELPFVRLVCGDFTVGEEEN